MDETLAFTIENAATVSGIGRTSLYRLIAEGKLEAVKAGRRTLISAGSLRAYIASLPPATIRNRTVA